VRQHARSDPRSVEVRHVFIWTPDQEIGRFAFTALEGVDLSNSGEHTSFGSGTIMNDNQVQIALLVVQVVLLFFQAISLIALIVYVFKTGQIASANQKSADLLARQINDQRTDQSNREITQLFERMVTTDFRRKLAFVYSREPEDLILPKLDQLEQEIVTEVSARFEELGFKVRWNVVPKQQAIEVFFDWVIPCAQQLRPNILNQREKRGPEYRYREQFDWLAKECKLFQLQREGYTPVSSETSLDELLSKRPFRITRTENATTATGSNSEAVP